MDNINVKQTQMKKTIDWNITGSLINEKFNLNITYADGKQETITDTLTNLIKIKNTLC